MALVIESLNVENLHNLHAGADEKDLDFFKAIAAASSVFHCLSLADGTTKLTQLLGDAFLVHETGHSISISKKIPGSEEGMQLVTLMDTNDDGLFRGKVLQTIHDFAVTCTK